MKSFVQYLFGLLLVASLWGVQSCNEQFVEEDSLRERVKLDLVLSHANLRSPALNTGDANAEDDVHHVRIYIFDNAGFLEKKVAFAAGTDDFQNPFRVADVVTGTKTVYVVANLPDPAVGDAPSRLYTELEAVRRIEEMEVVYHQADESSAAAPFLMMGSGTINVQKNATNRVNVDLQRLVAKVSLSLSKKLTAINAADVIQLTAVSLYRAAKSMPLLPTATAESPRPFWHKRYTLALPLTLSTTSHTMQWEGADALYLLENLGTAADTTDRVTYLVIEALYNGVPTRYRAYINDASSNADHHFSVKRNHHYMISASISSIGEYDGLTLRTQVVDWNFVSWPVLFKRVYSIKHHPSGDVPTEASHTWEVTTEDTKQQFKFKLENPQNVAWMANLSNALDFKIESGEIGTTDQEVIITIVPTKPMTSTPRRTEFFISVDGTEVPLLGNGMSGPNHRIIITQRQL